MTAEEKAQVLGLLEGAQRQIDAARLLLGGGEITRAALEAAGIRLGRDAAGSASDGVCPGCRERAPRVKDSIGAHAKTICGGCGYEYA